MCVLFRVDGTKEIGMGHIKRCISLAHGLRELGINVFFGVYGDEYVERLLESNEFKYKIIQHRAGLHGDYVEVLSLISEIKADIIIIDSYSIDDNYRFNLLGNCFVISIEDIGNQHKYSNAIINGNLHAEKLIYPESAGELFLGVGYLLLSREYCSEYGSEKCNANDVDNILITMGGVDHYNLSTRLMKELDLLKESFSISVIVGPYYNNELEILNQAKKLDRRVNIYKSPDGIAEIIKTSSLAICAGGQTLYEIASMGCPVIGLSLWPNQLSNVEQLSELNAIVGVKFRDAREFEVEVIQQARKLIMDRDARVQMTKRAMGIVDGLGVRRSSVAISNFYKHLITKRKSYE